MRRRQFNAGLGGAALAWPIAALAQNTRKLPRVGILTPAASDQTPIFQAFRSGLGDLGYVDGRTIVLDYRFAQGNYDVLARLARELVDVAVDVILADSSAGTLAAFQATHTIPIVTAVGSDPVSLGMATSVSHPGGNVTGFSHRPIELMGKRLQLLKYAFPSLARVAILVNPQSGCASHRPASRG